MHGSLHGGARARGNLDRVVVWRSVKETAEGLLTGCHSAPQCSIIHHDIRRRAQHARRGVGCVVRRAVIAFLRGDGSRVGGRGCDLEGAAQPHRALARVVAAALVVLVAICGLQGVAGGGDVVPAVVHCWRAWMLVGAGEREGGEREVREGPLRPV